MICNYFQDIFTSKRADDRFECYGYAIKLSLGRLVRGGDQKCFEYCPTLTKINKMSQRNEPLDISLNISFNSNLSHQERI